jgi:hypothetical protein
MRLPRPALSLVVPLALSLSACALAACSANAPPTDPTAPADSGTASFQVVAPPGMPIYVNRGGQWVPSTVVRQTGPATVLVHYEGMPAEWDEDVAFERVRSRPGASPAAPEYKVGELVLVSTQNRLFLAEVAQQIDAGTFKLHYQGFGPETVENVPVARIQKPFGGATAHQVGAAVLVDVGQPQPAPAKVLAAVAADKWLVRFDGAGPQYDQVIGTERIHPEPQAAPAVTMPVTAPLPSATADAGKAPDKPGKPDKPAKPDKPGKTPDAAPAAPAPLKAGDAVLVLIRSVYYPAKIVGAGAAAGSWKVRVDGAAADEEATSDHVARMNEPLKGVKYNANQPVFVEWHGVYGPAKVIQAAGGGNYKVRAEGKGAESDEVVPASRMRPR